ncbi:hypothetical protein [Zunongwangia sp.]|uniref:hypothetical protein n=1 Tax=Zunongwangia sp. TaxID=1965325 RepID=UPI003AA8DA4F
MRKIRILSIDRRGVRGILPGTILTYIEEQLRNKTGNPDAKTGEFFDFIAGTSTGGILSLIYLSQMNRENLSMELKKLSIFI